MKKMMAQLKWKHFANYIVISLLLIYFASMSLTGSLRSSSQYLLEKIAYSMILAVSLSILVGFLGELSLGHAGFMGVGAFSGAVIATVLLCAMPDPTLRLLVSMIVGGIFAAVMGVIIGIPVLRLRGDYLAIVTLAFGEILRNVINNLYIGFDAEGLRIALSEEALELAEVLGYEIVWQKRKDNS